MKSMALTGLYEIGMISTPDPIIRNEGDVLIRVTHMGVCGSDMHYYTEGRIGSNRVEYPFVLGHEGSGVVEHTGNGARGLSKGQRIAIEIETGKSDWRANLKKNRDKGFSEMVIISTNRETYERIAGEVRKRVHGVNVRVREAQEYG